jgi:hypothetical protein
MLISYTVSMRMLNAISWDPGDDGEVIAKEGIYCNCSRHKYIYLSANRNLVLRMTKHRKARIEEKLAMGHPKVTISSDKIDLTHVLDMISRWRADPQFDNLQSLGEDGAERSNNSRQC